MNKKLPGILVTGASGFIGRHFVIAISGKFRIFCIARRSQKVAGVPENDNTHWLQADITKWKNLKRVFEYGRKHGGVDYVLHLAGYYDFTLNENPVYEETNVTGTRYLLELSKMLDVKRFIFSSSLAACKFPPAGRGLVILSALGWVTGKEPLEKPWMAEYIDKKLTIDASVTLKALDWKPTPRYHILR